MYYNLNPPDKAIGRIWTYIQLVQTVTLLKQLEMVSLIPINKIMIHLGFALYCHDTQTKMYLLSWYKQSECVFWQQNCLGVTELIGNFPDILLCHMGIQLDMKFHDPMPIRILNLESYQIFQNAPVSTLYCMTLILKCYHGKDVNCLTFIVHQDWHLHLIVIPQMIRSPDMESSLMGLT